MKTKSSEEQCAAKQKSLHSSATTTVAAFGLVCVIDGLANNCEEKTKTNTALA